MHGIQCMVHYLLFFVFHTCYKCVIFCNYVILFKSYIHNGQEGTNVKAYFMLVMMNENVFQTQNKNDD
jgi:hypothetical protein